MKKVVFCAAALMMGAIGFAQNTSTVTETGEGNTAYVNQTGDNSSTVTQQYTDNTAWVDQSGDNTSSVIQRGDLNKGDVDQVGGAGNISILQQGNNDLAENNYAKIHQSGGDDNYSNVMQRWDNNVSYVTQAGSDNDVDLDQLARPNQNVGNYSNINQNGEGNYVKSWQENFADLGGAASEHSNFEDIDQMDSRNYLNSQQLGEKNYSRVMQEGNDFPAGAGYSNVAYLTQDGNYNRSTIVQDDAWVSGHADNYANVKQTGFSHSSTVTQHGANTAFVTQND